MGDFDLVTSSQTEVVKISVSEAGFTFMNCSSVRLLFKADLFLGNPRKKKNYKSACMPKMSYLLLCTGAFLMIYILPEVFGGGLFVGFGVGFWVFFFGKACLAPPVFSRCVCNDQLHFILAVGSISKTNVYIKHACCCTSKLLC